MNRYANPPSRHAAICVNNHPFPVLLYLEWGLLLIVLLSQLLPMAFREILPQFRLLVLGCALGFGAAGLRLPTGALPIRIAYILLQMGLMILASWFGGIRGFRLLPFFCVVLVIRSCLIFNLKGRVTVAGLTYLLFLVALIKHISSLPSPPLLGGRFRQEIARPLIGVFAFNSALLMGLVLLFVLLLLNALLNERRSREKLTQAHDQLRQYASRVEQLAMEQERSRIAREIHDSLGHALTALNLQLEGALKFWRANPERAYGFLTEAKTLGSTALKETRQSVAAMRSDPLQGKSLPEAIQTLVQEFQRTAQIQPTCQVTLTAPLPPELSTAVYRILQEALTNICKHAHASAVEITVATLPAAHPTELQITIQDNGQGFEPSQNLSGFGLQGMRERTLALGGQLDLHSAPHCGCQIRLRLPLNSLSKSVWSEQV